MLGVGTGGGADAQHTGCTGDEYGVSGQVRGGDVDGDAADAVGVERIAIAGAGGEFLD